MNLKALKEAASKACNDPGHFAISNPNTILSLIERVEAMERYARAASEALLKVRPLGGSELFQRVSPDEYLADTSYCGGLIDQLRADLHEAKIRTALSTITKE